MPDTEVLANIEGTNRRVNGIKRWLTKRPEGATELVLHTMMGDERITILRTDAEQAVPEVADELDNLVQDHANQMGAYVALQLQWWNKDGETLTTKILKSRPNKEDEGMYDELDGSAQSQARQAQVHHERLQRTYITAIGAQLSHNFKTTNHLAEQLTESNKAILKLTRDNMRLREENATLQTEVGDVEGETRAKAVDRALDMAETVVGREFEKQDREAARLTDGTNGKRKRKRLAKAK